MMTQQQLRIDVDQAYRRAREGKAQLVCAYKDAGKCEKYRLEGALTLGEFRGRLSEFPRHREIIFYCT